MISKEEVKHIAKLSRLELTEKEIEKMQKDMSAILDYFDLLKKAPKAEEFSGKKISENIFRKDNASQRDAEIVGKIIAQTPDKKDDYIKVKAIF
jgi:aspartyl-tRNA(Asn)/glutamyl-tRNA(Gln) amidotransferase subunit C